MERAVAYGIVRRNMSNIQNVGIDEKSFRRGKDYVSIITDRVTKLPSYQRGQRRH